MNLKALAAAAFGAVALLVPAGLAQASAPAAALCSVVIQHKPSGVLIEVSGPNRYVATFICRAAAQRLRADDGLNATWAQGSVGFTPARRRALTLCQHNAGRGYALTLLGDQHDRWTRNLVLRGLAIGAC